MMFLSCKATDSFILYGSVLFLELLGSWHCYVANCDCSLRNTVPGCNVHLLFKPFLEVDVS